MLAKMDADETVCIAATFWRSVRKSNCRERIRKMTQTERREYLIATLLKEQPQYSELEIPASEREQKILLRSLLNICIAQPVADNFLTIQDTYLQEEIRQKGITNFSDLKPVQKGVYLWRGDITTLAADAIVNAANSGLLGCFVPCHGCIDNAIHTYAGIQLRKECSELMKRQGHKEEAGRAKITKAYNLPCRYVLHTVGPIICGAVTKTDCELLASCYRSCLALAAEHDLSSLAFCCISTGEFHFPNELASQVAIRTVREWQRQNPNKIEVIFNVFKKLDYDIYERLLRADQTIDR